MDRTIHSQAFDDYNHSDTLFDSHFTSATQQENENNWFVQQRAYSRSVLAGWGLPLGDLSYSRDNEQTLRCLVELIAFRQKDLQFRGKVKDDMAAVNFEKEKYRSFMEQSQRNLQQSLKKLGKSQNEVSQMKAKGKKGETQARKQREQDKKMISMLRTKNQQILHDIKKKQQEVNRVKEQMKKSVGEKSNAVAKNSFEIFEGLSPTKRDGYKQQDAKYAFLMERNQREMAQLVKQNQILREKIFELRQNLLNFNEWVDRELFGQVVDDKYKRNSRFPLNHNLLFKKESLVDEFEQLLDVARDGINQLRDLYKATSGSGQKKTRSSEFLTGRDELEQISFKKKFSRPQFLKTDRNKPRNSEEVVDWKQLKIKNTDQNKNNEGAENLTPRSVKKIPVPKFQQPKSRTSIKNFTKGFQSKLQVEKEPSVNLVLQNSNLSVPFEDELLSDVGDGNDSSIVSHIDVSKLGKNRFDKWDILYQDDE